MGALHPQEKFRSFFQRRWRIVFFVFTVFLAGSLYLIFKSPPIYQASSTLRIESSRQKSFASEANLIQSRLLAERTAERIGLFKEGMTLEEREAVIDKVQAALSSERMGESDLVRIRAVSSNPKEAVQMAKTASELFIAWDLEEGSRQSQKRLDVLQTEVAEAKAALRGAEGDWQYFEESGGDPAVLAALKEQLKAFKLQRSAFLVRATEKHPEAVRMESRIRELETQLQALTGQEMERVRLSRELEAAESRYLLLKQRLEEARIAYAERVSGIRMVDADKRARSLTGARKRAILLGGGFLGLLLGLLLASFVEGIRRKVETKEEAERFLKLPVLGMLPPAPQIREDNSSNLVVLEEPSSVFAGAYHQLWSSLAVSKEEGGKAFLIASPLPQDGRSTVLSNLGLTAIQNGFRTLLIDGDFRNPSLHRLFQLTRSPGFTEVLKGEVSWQDAIRGLPDLLLGGLSIDRVSEVPGLDHLFILPAGDGFSESPALLVPRALEGLWPELQSHFDLLLIDSPPILTVPDATWLTLKSDGIVILSATGRTPRSSLLKAKKRLVAAGGRVLGTVLTEYEIDRFSDIPGGMLREPLRHRESQKKRFRSSRV